MQTTSLVLKQGEALELVQGVGRLFIYGDSLITQLWLRSYRTNSALECCLRQSEGSFGYKIDSIAYL